jgi:hypothetical protein
MLKEQHGRLLKGNFLFFLSASLIVKQKCALIPLIILFYYLQCDFPVKINILFVAF